MMMWRLGTKLSRGAGATVLIAGAFAASPLASGAASAATTHTCKGTAASPGVLTGSYSGDVVVSGFCAVDAGRAVVHGSVIITSGSVLGAAFGLNHATHHGGSGLVVTKDVVVRDGGGAVLGCDPQSFPCIDETNQKHPTLVSHVQIARDLTSQKPLGLLVHNASVGGNVTSTGGGGGVQCKPAGFFKQFQSPVFSAYEDMNVIGSLTISGMRSCWLGVNRVNVARSLSLLNNKLADPDAIEVLSNNVAGDLVCRGNSMVWDSADASPTGALFPRHPEPNTVHGKRQGQCTLNSPTKPGDKPGPGPF